jgi:hypothetical protein
MAIPFLNNINLSDNQLLNAKLHVTSTAPTAAAAQIYFDSTSSDLTAKYYSNSTDLWVSLKEYSFPTGNYVTGAVTGTTPKPIITFDLNALDGTASAGERYLTKTNKWAEISTIPGTYTWTVSDGSNSEAIASGDTVTWSGTGTTTVTYATASNTFTINSADQYVGTVTNVDAGTGLVIESGTSTVDPEIGIDYSGVDNYILSAGSVTDAAAADKINFNDADDNEVKQTTFGDIPIDALTEVKTYIDNSVAGGLIYQGGYNALTNTPDLTTSPNSIEKGWTYTVTADGTFFGEQLRVGDVLIAEVDDPSALGDWTTVQNNIDLASLTQIGIGNVNAEPAGNKDGLSVAYTSGTAAIGLDITNLPGLSVAITAADLASLEIPLYNGDTSDANEKIEVATLLSVASKAISYATTITDTATISHGLASSDVMVQLYDITTGETVYADVDRISTTQVTITFATTPTNSVRVLVQKIG